MKAEFLVVMAADERDVIGDLVAAQDRVVGQKDIRPQGVRISGDAQSRLRRFVGEHIEGGVPPLSPKLILEGRVEGVVPSARHGAFIGVERTARRVACQGLNVRGLLQVMTVPVSYIDLVSGVNGVIQTTGRKILARIVIEDAAIAFKCVDNIAVEGTLARRQARRLANGESAL